MTAPSAEDVAMKLAEDLCNVLKLASLHAQDGRHFGSTKGFAEGWNAACAFLSGIAGDEMAKAITTYAESVRPQWMPISEAPQLVRNVAESNPPRLGETLYKVFWTPRRKYWAVKYLHTSFPCLSA